MEKKLNKKVVSNMEIERVKKAENKLKELYYEYDKAAEESDGDLDWSSDHGYWKQVGELERELINEIKKLLEHEPSWDYKMVSDELLSKAIKSQYDLKDGSAVWSKIRRMKHPAEFLIEEIEEERKVESDSECG